MNISYVLIVAQQTKKLYELELIEYHRWTRSRSKQTEAKQFQSVELYKF